VAPRSRRCVERDRADIASRQVPPKTQLALRFATKAHQRRREASPRCSGVSHLVCVFKTAAYFELRRIEEARAEALRSWLML
jgi:hypothetical protein